MAQICEHSWQQEDGEEFMNFAFHNGSLLQACKNYTLN
jgi:hypothetical protein